MKERRENNGYCFIRGRTKPQHILSALHNIPYKLLPSTLKSVEDLLTNIGIEPSHPSPPRLDKINRDLASSAKKMEEMYEKYHDDDWMFSGTVPYIKEMSKCDYGQSEIEMAKDIDIRELYLGLEDAMYTFSRSLSNIKNILNDVGKNLIEEKHRDNLNDISLLASNLYRNKDEIYRTEDEEDKKNALDKFKVGVQRYWLEDWYDKYAWDFDEKERRILKNPYEMELHQKTVGDWLDDDYRKKRE